MVLGVLTAVVVDHAPCADCGRDMFRDGASLKIEAAWDDKKQSPVVEQIEALNASRHPSRNQRYEDIMERFERLSAFGFLEPKREWQHLEGDLWEIKTAEDRIPSFVSAATTKHKKAVRLSHLFEKRFGKTAEGRIPRKHKDKGLWMMRKDREHDSA